MVGRLAGVGLPDAASDSSTTLASTPLQGGKAVAFRIGDARLSLASVDELLAERFWRLYGDCHVDAAAESGPRVECTVRPLTHTAEISVELHDDEPLDLVHFLETVFADRGCRRLPSADSDWQIMESADPRVEFRVKGRQVVFSNRTEWRAMAANLAVALTLRLQPEIIFLHASGVAFGTGSQGVLFVGPKGAGKTTVALSLASRGHRFLGDEIVGVRQPTGGLVPVLRTIAKRDGPCAAAVDDMLSRMAVERVRYPDGELRTIVRPSRLFERAPSGVVLRAVVFLERFSSTPELRPARPSLAVAARLTPVTSTMWGQPASARAFALVRLLSSVPAYALTLGSPDATGPLLEDAFAC